MTDQPTPEPEDTCRPIDIDGETIRVRGEGEMSDESREALGEVVRAAKAKLTAEAPDMVGALQNRLRLAHQARRAKAHQLDDIRRALCDIGFMDDDDPHSHADLADVIRQNGRAMADGSSNQSNWPCSCGGSWPISHLHADEHTLLDVRTTPDNPATSGDGADNSLREQLITAVTAEVQSTAGPFGLIPRTVDAALATLEAHLDLGEAEAWCKACRRVWEGKQHRCESDAEQRLTKIRDLRTDLHGITGARWIADALDTILDEPALDQTAPSLAAPDELVGAYMPDPAIGCLSPGTDPTNPEPSDPTQCSGDEGFCPEHGFHRHSLKQPSLGQPVCVHPEGHEGECPCPSGCACCRVEAALHFHLAPAGLQEQIATSLENFPAACWTSGNITSRIMPLVAAAFDGYREAVANDAGAVRDREHAALKSAHVALAGQAGRDQAALKRLRERVQAAADEARGSMRDWLIDALADLPDPRQPSTATGHADPDGRYVACGRCSGMPLIPASQWQRHLGNKHQAAHDGGPTVAECAEADRVWPLEKTGE